METKVTKKKTGRKMRKWHKWGGLIFSFFFIMFALSGIFLNHRQSISSLDVSRSILPAPYQYTNWNNGAVKGTLKITPDSILMYGGAGIFLTDTLASHISAYETGMKPGTDNRITGSIVKTNEGNVFAISTFDLYRLNPEEDKWVNQSSLIDTDERLSDLQVKGDTVVVLSRSHLFFSVHPYKEFRKTELIAPVGYKKEATLFRTMWTLHSGELFGIPGKLFVDFLGIVAIILCLTGIIITFFPKLIKRRKNKQKDNKRLAKVLTKSFKLHNKLGVSLLVFLIILVVSGTFLRPPLLISIIRGKMKTLPGTVLNSGNPWFDKLRCIRYDHSAQEWILYSSDGFYRFTDLNVQPQKLKASPPVSVMGVNVFEQRSVNLWLVGSFSGLYYWDRETGKSLDAYTLKPVAMRRGGPPTISNAVSGYSADFVTGEIAFDYSQGAKGIKPQTQFAGMPGSVIENSRMSLWHLCLEVHVGRIYSPLIGAFADLFIFISGLICLSILISGYVVYRKRYKKTKSRL